MICGRVNPELEAICSVVLLSANGMPFSVNAAIDTGFNDSLALPRETIEQLQATLIGYSTAALGNGETVEFATFECEIEWLGRKNRVAVLETCGTALIGTELLRDCDVRIQFRPNGEITIERKS